MLKETLNNSRVALAFRRMCRQSMPLTHAGTAREAADAPGTPEAWSLTARVEAVLTSDPEFSGTLIRVEASGGTVTLQGFVDSPDEMLRALDLVGDVAGVETVANRLHLVWW